MTWIREWAGFGNNARPPTAMPSPSRWSHNRSGRQTPNQPVPRGWRGPPRSPPLLPRPATGSCRASHPVPGRPACQRTSRSNLEAGRAPACPILHPQGRGSSRPRGRTSPRTGSIMSKPASRSASVSPSSSTSTSSQKPAPPFSRSMHSVRISSQSQNVAVTQAVSISDPVAKSG